MQKYSHFCTGCTHDKSKFLYKCNYSSFIHQYSALRSVLAGTRTQSGKQYGPGTLHPGQILRGRLPLIPPPLDVPTFSARCLHVQRRERPLAAEVGTIRGREMFQQIQSRIRLPRNSRDLLHAANLRHGTDGFTSPPKDGVLRIFFALKNPTSSAGFEPANLGSKGQHATSRPPKPMNRIYGIKIRRHFVVVRTTTRSR